MLLCITTFPHKSYRFNISASRDPNITTSPHKRCAIYTDEEKPSRYYIHKPGKNNSSLISLFTILKSLLYFLVNDQRDAQILFYVFISIYNSLHVSSTSCLSSGETNCINTASGNSHSMLVAEMCAGWNLHTSRPPTENALRHIVLLPE